MADQAALIAAKKATREAQAKRDDAEIEAVVSYLAEIADQFEASIFGPDEN